MQAGRAEGLLYCLFAALPTHSQTFAIATFGRSNLNNQSKEVPFAA